MNFSLHQRSIQPLFNLHAFQQHLLTLEELSWGSLRGSILLRLLVANRMSCHKRRHDAQSMRLPGKCSFGHLNANLLIIVHTPVYSTCSPLCEALLIISALSKCAMCSHICVASVPIHNDSFCFCNHRQGLQTTFLICLWITWFEKPACL